MPCGTTGENPTLSNAEQRRVVEITLEEAKGKVPVLAGAGGYDTAGVAARGAASTKRWRADGILSVTPYYNRPTPEGLYQHYRAIAQATRLPIIVYNVPGRTGTNVDAKTLARLAGIDTVIGVKEASGNISQMAAIFQLVPEDFLVLSGDDAITLPLAALGGAGVISVASNVVPFDMVRLVEALPRGRLPRRLRGAPPAPPVDGGRLHRGEPRPGQGRARRPGPHRAGLAPADGAAAAAESLRRSSRCWPIWGSSPASTRPRRRPPRSGRARWWISPPRSTASSRRRPPPTRRSTSISSSASRRR